MSPFYNHGWSDLRAVRDDAGRYVRAPVPELYALAGDPGEEHNLLPAESARAEAYHRTLEAFLDAPEVDVRESTMQDMDADTRASLAALGYTWTAEEVDLSAAAGRADPKDRVHLWEREQYGNELVREGRYEEAIAVLRAYLEEAPGSITARTALAGALMYSGEEQAAVEVLRETVRLPGALSRTFVFLATLERELGDPGWPAHLDAARQVAPRDPYPWVLQAEWAQADGDPEAALAAYRAALELDDRCVDAWIGLGDTQHRRGRHREALEALERAVALDSSASAAWYDLGVVSDALGRLDDALASYERAYALAREDPNIVNALATALARKGNRTLAETRFREAINLAPDSFEPRFGLGVLLMQTDRPADAAAAFQRAAELAPERIEAWQSLMTASATTGHLETTLAAAERVIALSPDDVRARLIAARACAGLDRQADAVQHVRDAYARKPAQVEGLAARDPLLAGLLARVK